MNFCTQRLAEAFILLQFEEQAFEQEDDEVMIFMGQLRHQVIEELWAMRSQCDTSYLQSELTEVLQYHEKLQQKISVVYEDLKNRLTTRKKQEQLFSGSVFKAYHDEKAMCLDLKT